jgi:tRNA threonylcarbamoyl adenosine modification protein (Sua5/YciO/YrdC/YwlC family)
VTVNPARISVGDVARALERGEVVGIPTDTVYGLAASLAQAGAVDRLFALKGRPRGLAIPVLVADIVQAEALAGGADSRLTALADRFWPGALTIAIRRRGGPDAVLGGDSATVGVRCPDDGVVRALCRRVGPLAVTSANRHGAPPATSAEEFAAILGDEVDVVYDGGVRDLAPSTVVSIVEDVPRCLREGTVGFAEVAALLAGLHDTT